MKCKTLDDFKAFSGLLSAMIIAKHGTNPFYAAFILQFMRDVCEPLRDVDTRKTASAITVLANEKQTAAKDALAGSKKKSKGAARPGLNGKSVGCGRAADVGTYEEALDDSGDYDDFVRRIASRSCADEGADVIISSIRPRRRFDRESGTETESVACLTALHTIPSVFVDSESFHARGTTAIQTHFDLISLSPSAMVTPLSRQLHTSSKVTDKLAAHGPDAPYYTFEVFPPKTEIGTANLVDRIERMSSLNPTWLHVTWGAGGSTQERSLDLAGAAQAMGLDTCLHVTCTNMEQTVLDAALAVRPPPKLFRTDRVPCSGPRTSGLLTSWLYVEVRAIPCARRGN